MLPDISSQFCSFSVSLVTLVEKYRLQSLRRFTRITTQTSLSYTERRAIHFLAVFVINARKGEADAANNSPSGHICFYVWPFWAWITNRRQTGPEYRPLFYFRSLSSTPNQGLFPCVVCWRGLQQREGPTHILCINLYPECLHYTSTTRGLVLINTNAHSPGRQREKDRRLITPVKRGDRAPLISFLWTVKGQQLPF